MMMKTTTSVKRTEILNTNQTTNLLLISQNWTNPSISSLANGNGPHRSSKASLLVLVAVTQPRFGKSPSWFSADTFTLARTKDTNTSTIHTFSTSILTAGAKIKFPELLLRLVTATPQCSLVRASLFSAEKARSKSSETYTHLTRKPWPGIKDLKAVDLLQPDTDILAH